MGRCDGHLYLVFEEGVGDELRGIVVGHHHNDASNHFANLVVDKTLPNNIKA